jgi:hypothetical protein
MTLLVVARLPSLLDVARLRLLTIKVLHGQFTNFHCSFTAPEMNSPTADSRLPTQHCLASLVRRTRYHCLAQSESVTLWPTVNRPVCSGVQLQLGPKARFLLLSVAGLLTWGALSDERSSSEQSNSGPSPEGLTRIFYSPIRDFQYSHSSVTVTPLSTGFPFRRLLRLAGLQWKYSSSPTHGRNNDSVGRSVKLPLVFANIVTSCFTLLEIHDQDIYSLLDLDVFRHGASSTMKEVLVFPCEHYVCCTIVLVRVYPRCDLVQVSMNPVHPVTALYQVRFIQGIQRFAGRGSRAV